MQCRNTIYGMIKCKNQIYWLLQFKTKPIAIYVIR